MAHWLGLSKSQCSVATNLCPPIQPLNKVACLGLKYLSQVETLSSSSHSYDKAFIQLFMISWIVWRSLTHIKRDTNFMEVTIICPCTL
jgi:hypothetical protein